MYTTTRRPVAAALPLAGAASSPFAGQYSAALTADGPDDAPGHAASATPSLRLAPRLETACHIALCVTMGYMLIILL